MSNSEKNVYRISGIIWTHDPCGLGGSRQMDEYDSYAKKIVEKKPKTNNELREILENEQVFTHKLLDEIDEFLGLSYYSSLDKG